jgi:hypothetical protein
VYRAIVKLFFPSLKISDVDVGLKAFRRATFITLSQVVRRDGWSWDLEMLVKAVKRYRVAEVPLTWWEPEKSTVRLVNCSLEQFLGIIGIKYEIWQGNRRRSAYRFQNRQSDTQNRGE